MPPYTDALEHANQNKGTQSDNEWAGNGPYREMEFQHMRELLQVCLVVFIPTDNSWQVYCPDVGDLQAPGMCGKNIGNPDSCPSGVLYTINSDGVHFDTLVPQETDETDDTEIEGTLITG